MSRSALQEAVHQAEFISIAELLKQLTSVLTTHLPVVYFEGELGPVTRAGSGHLYFTVKDSNSKTVQVVQAVSWRGVAERLNFAPKEGLSVRCRGTPSIYPAGGRLQLVVEWMEQSGEGALKRRFEELKAKLAAEGLFNVERKRRLPSFPKGIGIVTSQTGAVIHDMMVKIRERMPSTEVLLANVRVQGAGAAEEIAAGLEALNRVVGLELIIVARGGGSLEDLWAFNEEVVVRAIFASRLPVISGVGHEVDVTLADLVADVRAPTPTAAAELAVPHRRELAERLAVYQRRLSATDRLLAPFRQALDDAQLKLNRGCQILLRAIRSKLDLLQLRVVAAEPSQRIATWRALLQNQHTRLSGQLTGRIAANSAELLQLNYRLSRFQGSLAPRRQELERHRRRLSDAIGRYLTQERRQLAYCKGRLGGVSPYSVVSRGYAIIRSGDEVVEQISQFKVGQQLSVQIKGGELSAEVKDVRLFK